jgi:hypothetical protein
MEYMQYLILIVWATFILVAAKLTSMIWSHLIGKVFYILITPGVAIRMILQAAACLATGAKITNMSLFEGTEPDVSHSDAKLPIVGKLILAVIPVLGCAFGLWIILALSGSSFLSSGSGVFSARLVPDTVTMSQEGIKTFGRACYDAADAFLANVPRANYQNVWTYVLAYLCLSLILAIAPSRKEMRSASVGLLLCIVLLFLTDLVITGMGVSGGLRRLVLKPVWPTVSIMVLSLAAVFAVSAAGYGLHSLIAILLGKDGKSGGKGTKPAQTDKPSRAKANE